MASRKVIRGNRIHILRQLEKATYGSHYIVVHPDLVTPREIYSGYAKAHIVENNDEIVIIVLFTNYKPNTQQDQAHLAREIETISKILAAVD